MQEFKGPWTGMIDGRYVGCDFEVDNVDFCSIEWCQVSDADGRVAAIVVGTEYHDKGDVDARAALISAAPELLEALQAAWAAMDRETACGSHLSTERAMARSAIAKALGQTQQQR